MAPLGGVENTILSPDETTSLLELERQQGRIHHREANPIQQEINPYHVIPLALFAALAMASTAATTVFAYASLLCKIPTHCETSESGTLAGAEAGAIFLANICALLVLGVSEKIFRNQRRTGLLLWIVCRSMSVIILALGVYFRNIAVALSGRIFEGMASDNILHFNLNAIYVQNSNGRSVSLLIGSSLALYMVGISISPALTGLFDSFAISVIIALSLFAFSAMYLSIFVGGKICSLKKADLDLGVSKNDSQHGSACAWLSMISIAQRIRSCVDMIFSPLQLFYTKPIAIFPGLSLLLYNAVQSYIFAAIMVHTSVHFGFSSKENGMLLSIAHAVSATYLVLTLIAIPRITRGLAGTRYQDSVSASTRYQATKDAFFALLSLSAQAISLILFAAAARSWQIYPISALTALGLAAPSYIKSHFVGFFSPTDGARAVAVMAIMETLGSLLAPVLLGGMQALRPGRDVFLVGATMVMGSAFLFGVGAFMQRFEKIQEVERQEPEPG